MRNREYINLLRNGAARLLCGLQFETLTLLTPRHFVDLLKYTTNENAWTDIAFTPFFILKFNSSLI